jgi:hypothetical protein
LKRLEENRDFFFSEALFWNNKIKKEKIRLKEFDPSSG